MIDYKIENINHKIEGEGPCILFVHGWGVDKDVFSSLVPYIKEKYTCVLVDLPGFGNSKEADNSLSIEEYSEILSLFLKDKSLAPYCVVGHSFGGKIACSYAMNNNLEKLVIISPSIIKPRLKINVEVKKIIYKSVKRWEKAKDFLNKRFSSNDYKNASPIMKETLIKATNNYYDNKLDCISCDTLIYWGKEDKETPLWMGKKIKKLIKNSELYTIEGGHYAFIDNKYNFLNVMESFLGKKK